MAKNKKKDTTKKQNKKQNKKTTTKSIKDNVGVENYKAAVSWINDALDNIADFGSTAETLDDIDDDDDDMIGATALAENILSITSSTAGIEGAPYQFLPSVDARINGAEGIGRKYAEKIFSRMPLLFITPCTAAFMQGFTKDEQKTMLEMILGGDQISGMEDASSLFENSGRFYTPINAYKAYYKDLNTMLRAVAIFLGIGDESVKTGNGHTMDLASADWSNDVNKDFATYFSAKENLVFFPDSLNRVSKSFSNTFGDSSLAATINGFSEQANELKFLFGTEGSVIADALQGTVNVTSGLSEAASSLIGKFGGGIVESLASDGVNTIMNGGKIIFPQIWQDSQYSESYDINFKFRSPDHDSLSIYLNILKPYCKLLALCMPHQDDNNPAGYNSPYICKFSCKGMFNIEYGAISGLQIEAGDTCQWNDDGLPTQMDVTLSIANLYEHLAMSKGKAKSVTKNTAYMDFLCNMAGLNIAQMEMGRKVKMYAMLTAADVKNIHSRVGLRFDQGITNAIGGIYNWLR